MTAPGLTYSRPRGEPAEERSEALLSAAVHLLDAVVLELDPAGVCRRCYGPVEQIGLATPALATRAVVDVLPEPLASELSRALAQLAHGGEDEERLAWCLRDGGRLRGAEVALMSLHDGAFVCTIRAAQAHGAALDERERNRLLETESRFRAMADHAPVLLWMSGRDSRCEFFNSRWLKFTGRAMEDERGVGWADGIHPEDLQRTMQTYLDAFVARTTFQMEYRLRRADGAYRWLFDQGVPRFTPAGEFMGYIGSCVDITEQRELLARLRWVNVELGRSIREREALLKELHHRVKNTLQVTCSLISLHTTRVASLDARLALEDCRARVAAMALVHERLGQFDDRMELDFPEYAAELVSTLFHAASPGPGTVALELHIGNVTLDVDQAIPCGLILNELVTNSLRHAFPDGRQGRLQVTLGETEQGSIQLVVRDDGVGMRGVPDAASTASLGWQLVSLFTEQLGGVVTCDVASGTAVQIEFSRRARARHEQRVKSGAA